MSVEVMIGFRETDRLTINVLHRLYPGARSPEDRRWLATKVLWSDPQFSGGFESNMWDVDFESLADNFDRLYTDLDGHFDWATMESDVGLEVAGDGIGHFKVRISLVGDHVEGPWIGSVIKIDQTELPDLVRSLREAARL